MMGRRWGIRCTNYTRGDRRGDILPNSSYENPRRSLTFKYSTKMARIKSEYKKSNGKWIPKPTLHQKVQAAKLARLAHCMDNYLREENDQIINLILKEREDHKEKLEDVTQKQQEMHERRIEQLQSDHVNHINTAIELIQRRDARIRQLEGQWEDLANSLHEAIEENRMLANKVHKLQMQLLDNMDTESESE